MVKIHLKQYFVMLLVSDSILFFDFVFFKGCDLWMIFFLFFIFFQSFCSIVRKRNFMFGIICSLIKLMFDGWMLLSLILSMSFLMPKLILLFVVFSFLTQIIILLILYSWNCRRSCLMKRTRLIFYIHIFNL